MSAGLAVVEAALQAVPPVVNAVSNARNRKWQEYMSNTAVSRRKDDLNNAGINPVLAGFEGASTPSGGVASSSYDPQLVENVYKGKDFGLREKSTQLLLQKGKEEIANLTASRDLLAAQAGKVRAETNIDNQEFLNRILTGRKISSETDFTNENLVGLRYRNERDKTVAAIAQMVKLPLDMTQKALDGGSLFNLGKFIFQVLHPREHQVIPWNGKFNQSHAEKAGKATFK